MAASILRPQSLLKAIAGSGLWLGLAAAFGVVELAILVLAVRFLFIVAQDLRHITLV